MNAREYGQAIDEKRKKKMSNVNWRSGLNREKRCQERLNQWTFSSSDGSDSNLYSRLHLRLRLRFRLRLRLFSSFFCILACSFQSFVVHSFLLKLEIDAELKSNLQFDQSVIFFSPFLFLYFFFLF